MCKTAHWKDDSVSHETREVVAMLMKEWHQDHHRLQMNKVILGTRIVVSAVKTGWSCHSMAVISSINSWNSFIP